MKEPHHVTNWQPIETAPKDGTWIFLTGGEQDQTWYSQNGRQFPPVVVGCWDVEDDAYQLPEDEEIYGPQPWAIGCIWDGELRSGYENPTHWMPLPTPPEPTA